MYFFSPNFGPTYLSKKPFKIDLTFLMALEEADLLQETMVEMLSSFGGPTFA
jgi:hypothetical protein